MLPFFAPALREFTKVMSPPFIHLISKGHLSVKCLDNSLLMEETIIMCLNNVIDTADLLKSLGFTIQHNKLVLVSRQKNFILRFHN